MVQKPKAKEGLGVINLRVQNDALLLKQLHKFYTKYDTLWVKLILLSYYQHKVPHAAREIGSFWWKDIFRLNVLYRGIAKCNLGNGSSVLFWEDLGAPVVLAHEFPSLFQYASNTRASVSDIITAPDMASVFNLPLPQQAIDELIPMQNILATVPYDENAADKWIFLWGNGNYSSQKLYKLAFAGLEVPQTFQWICKSKCILRIKFFTWLLAVD
jgi:hypothetical protein